MATKAKPKKLTKAQQAAADAAADIAETEEPTEEFIPEGGPDSDEANPPDADENPDEEHVRFVPDGDDARIESLRGLLLELERYVLWMEADQGLHFETKVVIVVQTRGTKKNLLGHFASTRWFTKEGEPIHEISIVAEQLLRDPFDVLETLTHELTHLHNDEQGIKDTSASQRHNKKFKAAAEDFGLVVGDPDKSRGYDATSLGEELRQDIATKFVPDLTAFRLFRDINPPKDKAPTKNKKYSCQCDPPVNVRSAVELHAHCDICNEEFELQ